MISYFDVIPTFHHTLSKHPFEGDLKWNILKWNCLLLRIPFGDQKLFHIRKEKSSFYDLSRDVRKSFSASKSFTTFSFILKNQLR